MPGYGADRFPNLSPTERSEYTCSICQDIFRCPMTAPCCLQTFCEHCIGNYLKTNNTCPYCKLSYTGKTLSVNGLSQPSREFINMIGKLEIQCNFQDKGCKEVVNLDDLIQHTNKCGYNPENYGKKCEICLCNQKSGHDCIKSLLELNRKANEEIRTLKNRPQITEPSVRSPPPQSTSIMNSSADLASSSREQSLMHEINELKTEKMNFLKTIQDLVNSTDTPAHPITNDEPSVLNLEDKLIMVRMFGDMLVSDCEYPSLVIYMVHRLLLDMSPDQKELVIEFPIFDLISVLLKTQIKDSIVSRAWSIMLTLSDCSASNCAKIVDNKIIDDFATSLNNYSDNMDLIDTMTGVMANIAECEDLRTKFMKINLIQTFIELLDTNRYGIQISYKSVIILTNLASSKNNWQTSPLNYSERDEMLLKLDIEVSGWKINYDLGIRYRSLEPILKLLKPDMPSDTQYLAVWTLANLTRLQSQRYCPLLVKEKGVQLLNELIQRPNIAAHVQQLASLTLYQYELSLDLNNQIDLKDNDNIDIPTDFMRRLQIRQ